MRKLEEVYLVKGEVKHSLFNEYTDFERKVNKDELIEMLHDYKYIIHEITRTTRVVEVEDDWTVM